MRPEQFKSADNPRELTVDQKLDIYRDELSGDFDIYDEDVAKLRSRIESGDEVLVHDPHAFAIVKGPDTPDQFLTFLWVDPEHRGKGYGKRLMHRLIELYPVYHWSLRCHKRLRPFYSRFKFFVSERLGDNRRMSTNRGNN